MKVPVRTASRRRVIGSLPASRPNATTQARPPRPRWASGYQAFEFGTSIDRRDRVSHPGVHMEFLDLWHDYFSSRVIGAVGSALPSHGRGRGFESRITHREKGLVPAQSWLRAFTLSRLPLGQTWDKPRTGTQRIFLVRRRRRISRRHGVAYLVRALPFRRPRLHQLGADLLPNCSEID